MLKSKEWEALLETWEPLELNGPYLIHGYNEKSSEKREEYIFKSEKCLGNFYKSTFKHVISLRV